MHKSDAPNGYVIFIIYILDPIFSAVAFITSKSSFAVISDKFIQYNNVMVG